MSVLRVRTGALLGSIGTTRYVTLGTNTYTTVQLSTGYTAMEVVNTGSNQCIYAFSSVAVGSGTVLFTQDHTPRWDNCEDAFATYWIAESAATTIAIHEYL